MILLQQFLGLAGFGVAVVNADKLHDARAGLRHHLRHADAEPAIHQVLFGNHDGAGLRGGARDGIAVERLHGMHVDDAHGHALGFQRLRRQDGLCHQQAVGDDGDVRAITTWMDLPISNVCPAV